MEEDKHEIGLMLDKVSVHEQEIVYELSSELPHFFAETTAIKGSPGHSLSQILLFLAGDTIGSNTALLQRVSLKVKKCTPKMKKETSRIAQNCNGKLFSRLLLLELTRLTSKTWLLGGSFPFLLLW